MKKYKLLIFLNKISVVSIDGESKNLTISLHKQYRLRLPDAIIAATAQSLNAKLFTNDVKLTNLTEISIQTVQLK